MIRRDKQNPTIMHVSADFRFDGKALRRASEVAAFPWLIKLVTLVRITSDGVVTQAKSDAEKRNMLGEADEHDLLLAAWPGEWSQDVFVVDDLKSARVSVGLTRHKGVPDVVSGPHGGAPAGGHFVASVGLWQRLAESPSLSLEGQRQLAMEPARRFANVALALLSRPELDEEARHQMLRTDGYRVPETLVASGLLTGAEIAALVDNHLDSGDLLQAALCSPEGKAAAQGRIASLSFAEATDIWMRSHLWSKRRPELAAELLLVILAASADSPCDETPRDARYERLSVIRSIASSLLPEKRLELLLSADYGRSLQQALLADERSDGLSEEELIACLPEITSPQQYLSAGGIPDVSEYIQRFPRVVDLARPQLEQAVTDLIAGGWSPVECARSGQWYVLLNVARIAETPNLLDKLARASVHDRADITGSAGPFLQRWRDPRRYDLIETLLRKMLIPDAAADHVLDRLAESEVNDIVTMADGSRLQNLCAAALQRRPSHAVTSYRVTARPLEKLPSDEELSRASDPQAILLGLIKSRDMDRDRKIQHALSSSYLTDDLAWQVRVSALEGHPVFGPKLAANIAEICGDSPACWQELFRSWNQTPTQLLVSTLFKRLRNATAAD